MQDGRGSRSGGTSNGNENGKQNVVSCMVKFRPCKDWRGEYGFDWVREDSDFFEEVIVPDEGSYFRDIGLEKKERAEHLRDILAKLDNGEEIDDEFQSLDDIAFYGHLNPVFPWTNSLVQVHQEIKKERNTEQLRSDLKHAIAAEELNVVCDKTLSDKASIGEYAYQPFSKNQRFSHIIRVKYKLSDDLISNEKRIWETVKLEYLDDWNGNAVAEDTEKLLKEGNGEFILNAYICIPSNSSGKLGGKVSCFADLNNKTVKLPYYYGEMGKFYLDNKWSIIDFDTKIQIYIGKSQVKGTSQTFIDFMRLIATKAPESVSNNDFENKCVIQNNLIHFLKDIIKEWPYKKVNFKINEYDYQFVYRTMEDASKNVKFVYATVKDVEKAISHEMLFEDDKLSMVLISGKWVSINTLDDAEKETYNAYLKETDEEGFISRQMLNTDEMVPPKIKQDYHDVHIELYRPNSIEVLKLGNFSDDIPAKSGLLTHYIEFGEKKLQLKTWYEEYLETFKPLTTNNEDIKEEITVETYPVPTLSTALSLTKERKKFFYRGNNELPTMKNLEQSDEYEIQYYFDKNHDIPNKLRLQSDCPMLSFKKKYGGAGFENPLNISNPKEDDSIIVKIQECSQTCDFCIKNNKTWRGKTFYEERSFHKGNDHWTLYKPTILARGEFDGKKYLPSSILSHEICGQLDVQIGDGLKMPLLFVDVKVDGMSHSNSLKDVMKIQKEFSKNIASHAGISLEIFDDFEISLEKQLMKKYQTKNGFIDIDAPNDGIKTLLSDLVKLFLNNYSESEIVKKYSDNSPVFFIFDKAFSRLKAFQTFIPINKNKYNVIAVSNSISKTGLSHVCVHEIIHALKNPHSFQLRANDAYGDNDFCFRYLKSSNVMDYVLMAYSTRRFQWERMRSGVEQSYRSRNKSN